MKNRSVAMAPVAAAVAGEWICAPQQNRQPRELDRATAEAGATLIRMARPSDVRPILDIAEALIGSGLATEDILQRLLAWRPDSLWAFVRHGKVVGGFSMLLLNSEGVDALLAATLNTREPPYEFLTRRTEAPSAIYISGSAHLSATDAMLKMLVRLQSTPYERANIYAVPHTVSGLRFHQRWGFHPVPGHPRHLSEYIRICNRRYR